MLALARALCQAGAAPALASLLSHRARLDGAALRVWREAAAALAAALREAPPAPSAPSSSPPSAAATAAGAAAAAAGAAAAGAAAAGGEEEAEALLDLLLRVKVHAHRVLTLALTNTAKP